jgi:hypothetical protein
VVLQGKERHRRSESFEKDYVKLSTSGKQRTSTDGIRFIINCNKAPEIMNSNPLSAIRVISFCLNSYCCK